ncbi:STAS domain-containing protein [Oceanicoccus sp. KOV_DT_Chl]|uniref:STAS domain-containing protein n=1 Tax=Oceanicoccus sp. KOV_DT_Chl TaxID=1904639 RepID=UPI000C7E3379|nr:STAS domain-containing protein [Oceanicoccus sp. KOV_DT_Chl]
MPEKVCFNHIICFRDAYSQPQSQIKSVVIDFSGTKEFSSAIFGMLAHLGRYFQGKNTPIKLEGLSPKLDLLFHIAKIQTLITH